MDLKITCVNVNYEVLPGWHQFPLFEFLGYFYMQKNQISTLRFIPLRLHCTASFQDHGSPQYVSFHQWMYKKNYTRSPIIKTKYVWFCTLIYILKNFRELHLLIKSFFVYKLFYVFLNINVFFMPINSSSLWNE